MKETDFETWFWANIGDIVKKLYVCNKCDLEGKVIVRGKKVACPDCKGECYVERFTLDGKEAITLAGLYAKFGPWQPKIKREVRK
jgi:hypothetical protein